MRTSEDRISTDRATFDAGSPKAAPSHIVGIIVADRYARDERVFAEDRSSIDAEFVTEGDARVEKAGLSC
jgi:hypothetical protein